MTLDGGRSCGRGRETALGVDEGLAVRPLAHLVDDAPARSDVGSVGRRPHRGRLWVRAHSLRLRGRRHGRRRRARAYAHASEGALLNFAPRVLGHAKTLLPAGVAGVAAGAAGAAGLAPATATGLTGAVRGPAGPAPPFIRTAHGRAAQRSQKTDLCVACRSAAASGSRRGRTWGARTGGCDPGGTPPAPWAWAATARAAADGRAP